MSSVVSRADIVKELKPTLRSILALEYPRYGEQWKQFFKTDTSDKFYEEMTLVTNLGLATVKEEGADTLLDSFGESYTVRTEHVVVATGYSITEEAIEDNLYRNENQIKGAGMARSFGETKNIRAAAILNNGFSAGAPIGDGVAFFSDSHPLASGNTGDNRLAADLSEASAKASWVLTRGFTDDRDLKVQAKPQMLILHPSEYFNALEITRSDLSTSVTNVTSAGALNGSSNVVGVTNTNNINSVRVGGVFPQGMAVYDYLTDADSWYVKTDIKDCLFHFQRRKLNFRMDYKAPLSGNILVTGNERYSFMVGDWRGMLGSEGQ